MCQLGLAWKPRLRLGFSRLRLCKIKAWAVAIGLGWLRLGLGLGHGQWENSHMNAHTTAFFESKPPHCLTSGIDWPVTVSHCRREDYWFIQVGLPVTNVRFPFRLFLPLFFWFRSPYLSVRQSFYLFASIPPSFAYAFHIFPTKHILNIDFSAHQVTTWAWRILKP